jgi:hypothetical protein
MNKSFFYRIPAIMGMTILKAAQFDQRNYECCRSTTYVKFLSLNQHANKTIQNEIRGNCLSPL